MWNKKCARERLTCCPQRGLLGLLAMMALRLKGMHDSGGSLKLELPLEIHLILPGIEYISG